MKNLPIILETSKKRTLILNNDDDLKFGIEISLFHLAVVLRVNGQDISVICEGKYT